jgi:hypothetical protein
MTEGAAMGLGLQIVVLLILAVPVACVSWTVTHEEVFKEPREWCLQRSRSGRSLLTRKFFYLFTCEYCFSHYVSIAVLVLTRFTLVYPDWRGYLIAGFALVWVANVYMSLFGRLRLEIRHERQEIQMEETLGGSRPAGGVLRQSARKG